MWVVARRCCPERPRRRAADLPPLSLRGPGGQSHPAFRARASRRRGAANAGQLRLRVDALQRLACSRRKNFDDYFAGLDLAKLGGRSGPRRGVRDGAACTPDRPFAGRVVAVDFSRAIDQAARNTQSSPTLIACRPICWRFLSRRILRLRIFAWCPSPSGRYRAALARTGAKSEARRAPSRIPLLEEARLAGPAARGRDASSPGHCRMPHPGPARDLLVAERCAVRVCRAAVRSLSAFGVTWHRRGRCSSISSIP